MSSDENSMSNDWALEFRVVYANKIIKTKNKCRQPVIRQIYTNELHLTHVSTSNGLEIK